MAILETTFMIDILRGRKEAAALLDGLEKKGETLFATAPTVMELWEGALEGGIPAREKARVEEFLAALAVLPLDVPAAMRAAEILFDLARKGAPIEIEDAMIAGIAMCRGEIIVTRDAHFARIPGLKVLKY